MQNANLNEILSRAKEIVGMTINQLIGREHLTVSNKGMLGNYIEEYGFGIKNNNDAEPDFKKEKIELKIVPIVKYKSREEFRIKERTKVCSLNYNTISNQKWSSSDAKHKLNRVLFIFYSYNIVNPGLSEIKQFHFYELREQGSDELILKSDWSKIKEEIVSCRAHLLSERLTKILAASRAGAGGGKDDVKIKHCDIDIKIPKRAFSLKPAFTRVIWNEINASKGLEYISLKTKYSFQSANDVEKILVEKTSLLRGKTLAAIQRKFSLPTVTGKGSAASIVKAALGFKGRKPIKEIEQLGIEVKVIPINSTTGDPWEAMSFPYQPLKEIERENSFEESEFYDHIQGLLIIPIYRETAERDIENEKVGQPFIWHPNTNELATIKKEWNKYKSSIKRGVKTRKEPNNSAKGYKVVTSLPKESQTQIIHIRPHARNSYDLDPSMPENKEISKQCFWLNKKFLKSLVLANK